MKIIDGNPGVGKTKTMVGIALQDFKKNNTKRLRKQRLKKGYDKTNAFVDSNGFYHYIFTNFPILLNKKYNIYSQKTSLFYFTFDYRFPQDSLHFLMEGQLPYDSMDFKQFPDIIANYLQLHRHQMVKDILIDSQSISRLPKYERIVACEWWRIVNSVRIPLLNIEIKFYNSTYQLESDTGSSMLEGEEKWTKHWKIIWNIRKVHESYDDLCMRALSENAKMIDFNMFDSLVMTKADIKELHFRTKEEKDILAKRDIFENNSDIKTPTMES